MVHNISKEEKANIRANELLKTLQNFENPFSLPVGPAPEIQVEELSVLVLASKVQESTLVEAEDQTAAEEILVGEQPSISELLETLRAAASTLERIGEEGNLLDWIRMNSAEDPETIDELGRTCAMISSAIQPRGQSCGILEEVESFYLFRGPSFMMVLQPVETFKALKTRCLAKKTISFAIIKGGGGLPLRYGISGWTDFLQPHPKFLDCAFWTSQVLNLSQALNFDLFPRGRLDHHHGVAVGTDYASHAENRIILSSACEFAGRLFGKVTVKDQVAALHRLKTLSNLPTVEVFVSEEPCRRCRKFKNLLQDYTGITFEFRFLQRKLGEVKCPEGTHGPYPRWASAVENLEEEPMQQFSPRKRLVRAVDDTSSNESDFSPSWALVSPRRKLAGSSLITPVTSPGENEL